MTTHIGLADIGRILGVSKQRAAQLARRPDFPPAVVFTSNGRFWLPEDITTWESTWDRTNPSSRPRKPEAAAP